MKRLWNLLTGGDKRTPTKRLRLALEALEDRVLMTANAAFTWKMADRFGIDQDSDGLIDMHNSATFVQAPSFRVNLDAGPSTADAAITAFNWSITGDQLPNATLNLPATITRTGRQPSLDLPQGVYYVNLTITAGADTVTFTDTVRVKDLLIVSMGDSVSSGEGNPEINRSLVSNPQWADTEFGPLSPDVLTMGKLAHRSSKAYAAQAALALEQADPHTSVTFVSVASSGASVESGLVNGQGWSLEDANTTRMGVGQIQQVKDIVGTRRIDALVITVGADDIGFGTIVKDVVMLPELPGMASHSTFTALQTETAGFINSLPTVYGDLNQGLQTMGVEIGRVFLTEYFDPTTGDNGMVPASSLDDIAPMLKADLTEATWAQTQVVRQLNVKIHDAAAQFGWTVVEGVDEAFLTHGYSATDHWVRRAPESADIQGPRLDATGGVAGAALAATVTFVGVEVAGASLGFAVGFAVGGPAGAAMGQAIGASYAFPAATLSSAAAAAFVGTFLSAWDNAHTKGTLHPNDKGHSKIKDLTLATMGDTTALGDPLAVTVAGPALPNGITNGGGLLTVAPNGRLGRGHALVLRQSPFNAAFTELRVDGKTLFAWRSSTILGLNIDAGGGTIAVQDTPQGVAVRAFGATTVDVGKNGSVQTIRGTLTVGGTMRSTLTVNDSSDATARTVNLTEFGIFGLAPATIGFVPNGLTSVTVRGGSGSNTINVPSIAANTPVTLYAGLGNDTVNVGAVQPMNLFQPERTAQRTTPFNRLETLTIYGQTGNDVVNIDTLTILVQPTLTITPPPTATPTSPSLVLTGGTPATPTSPTAPTSGTTSGTTPTTPTASPSGPIGVPVFVYGNEDNDTVNISPGRQFLDNVKGAVTVNGGSGVNTVNLFDQADTFTETYTVTANTVARNYFGGLTYSGLTTLVLNTTASAATVNVRATPAGMQTVINAGNQNDTVTVGSTGNLLDGVQGSLTFNGQGGGDFLQLRDTGASVSRTFALVPGAVQRPALGTIAYTSVEQVRLDAGSGSDTFNLSGNAAEVDFTLNAGSGNDQVRLSNPVAMLGAIRVAGEAGEDKLDYSAFSSRVTVNLRLNHASNLTALSGIENVTGGAGSDLLVGDGAANELRGNGGKDVLIGGAGADFLDGGSGDDLLIGSGTVFDTNTSALMALWNTWSNATTYTGGVAALGGLAFLGIVGGAIQLNSSAVVDDNIPDQLLGGLGQDYFRGKLSGTGADLFLDFATNEFLN